MPEQPAGYGAAFRAPRKAAGRVPLSREAIVGTAIAILDADGADALTFRRLAADLKVGVASLYWHVESKDVLMDLALDQVLGEIVSQQPAGPWQDRLRTAGLAVYDLFLQHRWAPGQMIVSSDRGPNTLRLWEYTGGILVEAGLSAQSAFDALSLLLNHALASGVQEATWDPTGSMPPQERRRQLEEMGEFLAGLDPEEFPNVVRTARILAEHDQTEQFTEGLNVIIAGLEQKLSRSAG